jgi:putative membrane protein
MSAILLIVTVWSGYRAFHLTLWFLEAGFCFIGIGILAATYKRFRFTELTYFFIFLHIIILLVGAHYSYSRVPLFSWLQEMMGSSRNNYDKLGHFAQGFIPALIVREILIRLQVLRLRSWLPFLVTCVCLSISAFYELIEWWCAGIFKQSAEDFLGMQGYIWDTQSDMLCALIGAICMLILLSKPQDKQIAALTGEPK